MLPPRPCWLRSSLRSSLVAGALLVAAPVVPAAAASAAAKPASKKVEAPPKPPAAETKPPEPAAATKEQAAGSPRGELPPELRELVRRYGSARSARFFDVTTDGTRLLVGTRFGEARQIHLVETPLGDRTQISFGEEPVHAARFLPQDPNVVLFLQASSGNQNYQFYKLERDSGKVSRMSDGKTRIDHLLLARDGRRLSWSASTNEGKDSAVFVAEADTPNAPRRLTPSGSGAYWPIDFSPNGRHVLVLHERSRGDAELYAIPVDAPAPKKDDPEPGGKKLWPREGTASVRAAAYSADGHDLFLVSDKLGAYQELLRIDPDRPELPARRITQGLDADVDALAVSQDRGAPASAAVTVAQDGYDRMYLLEPGTLALMPVALPPGVVSALRFPTVRADLLYIGLSSPRRPEDVYQLDVRSRRITRWTNSELGPIDPAQLLLPEPASWLSGGEKIPALIYRPRNDTGAKLPVLLALHDGLDGAGGPLSSAAAAGEADLSRPGFDANAQLYANELGVAVVAPMQRGSVGLGKHFLESDPAARADLQLKDVAAALDWIAAQPDLDASRVVVASDSGSLAQKAWAQYPTRLKGAVPLEGAPDSGAPLPLERKHERDAALGQSLVFLREKLLGYPSDGKPERKPEPTAASGH